MHVKINMHAGLVTNGEWNSLRTAGNTRPLSVFQIRSNVRSKYSRMGETKLMKMLTPVCKYTYAHTHTHIYIHSHTHVQGLFQGGQGVLLLPLLEIGFPYRVVPLDLYLHPPLKFAAMCLRPLE